jgi:glycosyltransferase involved in cell wall biosynthesis
MDLVSVVIPCHNPDEFLLETIASARAQKNARIEIVLVDDGSRGEESKSIFESAAPHVDRFVHQANKGVSAARNAGIRAAAGDFIVPIDSSDLLKPDYVWRCFAALHQHPDAAFIYGDYRVFGDRNYVERLPDYNFFDLLERNILGYSALFRKDHWEQAGGYCESLIGHEDWDFFLSLGERGHFGHHIPQVLWSYRKHGRSLSDVALERHDELVRKIRAKHSALFTPDGYARVKRKWRPAVCVAGPPPRDPQTICDWEAVDAHDRAELLAASRAPAFFFPKDSSLDSHAVEWAALAAWGAANAVTLPDGSTVVPRGTMTKLERARPSSRDLRTPRAPLRSVETIWRHLANAGLLSSEEWTRHPLRSAGRLVPLRVKERVNQAAGRPVFDLTFYLKFQPKSLALSDRVVEPLRYLPPAATRRRIALITPHLGPGGAERVLMDIADSLDRSLNELLLIATHSSDASWRDQWRERADHVYDLASLVPDTHIVPAIYSIVSNWQCGAMLVQNALSGYAAIPLLKRAMPGLRVIDLIHATGSNWDVISATASVAKEIDTRVTISEAVRERAGAAARLIRNGIDLGRFSPNPSAGRNRILFAGRLDPVKRPELLPEIAAALAKLRPARDFRFAVAGDGPEMPALKSTIAAAGLGDVFEILGHVPDIAPAIADSDLLIVPSKIEGIPLVILEAFASARPVIASNTGAIAEAVDDSNGILIPQQGDEAVAFAAAIHRLMEHSDLRIEMGRRGRIKVEREYDRNAARRAYRQLFE